MRRSRWVLFEAMKFALVLSVFSYTYSRVDDSRHRAYASTESLSADQRRQAERLESLEADREMSEASLERTLNAVLRVKTELASASQQISSDRDEISRLIDDRAHELRSYLETGIERIEGSAFEHSEQVTERVSNLEHRIQRSPTLMKQRMIYPVVQLRGNGTVGSGVVISSQKLDPDGKALTYVLTAFHVVQEITEGLPDPTIVSDVKFVDAKTDGLCDHEQEARVVAFDADIDIALLKLELDEVWPYAASLASTREGDLVEIFDAVYAVGCPLGNKPLPTVGEISSQEKMVAGQNFWMLNAPTFFGNSGGGIFKVTNGHLIGISSMIYTYGKTQPMVVPHMGLFVPLQTVRNWMTGEGYAYLAAGSEPSTSIQTASSGEIVTEPKISATGDTTPK